MSVPEQAPDFSCSDSEGFARWLDEHGWFEDAMVRALSPTPGTAGEAPPSIVTLELAHQVGGGLRAGDTRQLRRVQLRCSRVTRFELEELGTYSPQHWSEGVELFPTSAGISFWIDVPGRLLIACERVEATELAGGTEAVLPWESDREIAITFANRLPSPAEIVKRCAARIGVDLAWRIYSTDAVPVSEVPENHDGWFLQLPARVAEELGGIMTGIHAARERTPALTLTRMETAEGGTLWAAVLATLATFDIVRATCGNRELNQDDFCELADRKRRAAGL